MTIFMIAKVIMIILTITAILIVIRIMTEQTQKRKNIHNSG